MQFPRLEAGRPHFHPLWLSYDIFHEFKPAWLHLITTESRQEGATHIDVIDLRLGDDGFSPITCISTWTTLGSRWRRSQEYFCSKLEKKMRLWRGSERWEGHLWILNPSLSQLILSPLHSKYSRQYPGPWLSIWLILTAYSDLVERVDHSFEESELKSWVSFLLDWKRIWSDSRLLSWSLNSTLVVRTIVGLFPEVGMQLKNHCLAPSWKLC